MQIRRMTMALELFFREPILADADRFVRAMMSNGFSIMSEEQHIVARGSFTARPSRFTRIRGKGMNIAAIAVTEEQIGDFISHINLIRMIVRDEMDESIDGNLRACSLLTNAWVRGSMQASRVVEGASVKSITKVLDGFIAHRNPFGKIEFVSIPRGDSGEGEEWSRMELDYTDEDEYLISIHNHTYSLARIFEHLQGMSKYIAYVIGAVEGSCPAG
ncbi:MAG: hypothetical protein RMJ59_06925 [Candidatus Nitrosocaldus sp.]|nr:hypothetical protein [Candidatus Nitrosocaldus sp.]MDW8276092.1 hypothetical protein [Candidatus Nitrosocaldus sp.]